MKGNRQGQSPSNKPSVGQHPCFSNDWTRTEPDLVVYLPTKPPYADEAGDHVLADVTPDGDLLAIWTLATKKDVSDNSVVYARNETTALPGLSPQRLQRRRS